MDPRGGLEPSCSVKDLSRPSCFQETTENLTIRGARELKSLSGLERLTKIGGMHVIGERCEREGNGYTREAIDALQTFPLPALRTVKSIYMRAKPYLDAS